MLVVLAGAYPVVLNNYYLRRGLLAKEIDKNIIDRFLLFLVLFVSVYDSPLRLLKLPLIGTYSDELIAVLLLFRIVFIGGKKLNSRQVSIGVFILAFFAVGAISSLINGDQTDIQSQMNQGFLWLKMWVVVWFVWKIKIDISKVTSYVIVFLKSSLYISAISVIFQLSSVTWRSTFNGLYSDRRYFVESFSGFAAHPTFLASLSGVTTIIFIVYKSRYLFISKFDITLALILTIGTGRRRIIIGILICIVFLKLFRSHQEDISKRALIFISSLVILLLTLPTLAGLAQSLISTYLIEGNNSARYLLYQYGYLTAVKFLPLGSGFASFGTLESTRNYSSTYLDYGFDSIYGLSSKYDYFVTDTFWPALLAETGFLGAILYGAALILGIWTAKQIHLINEKSPEMYPILVGLTLFTVIDSLGAQTYLSQPIAFIFAIFFASATGNHYANRNLPKRITSRF